MSPATISSSQVNESATKKRKLVDSEDKTEIPSLPAAVSSTPVLQVKLLSDKAKVPTRGSALAAGYDIYGVEDYLIKAQDRGVIETDIAVAVPAGYYGRIAPRSGLATKHGLQTGAGVVDADYRGPLKILLFNHSNKDFQVHAGDRLAQMVIEKIITPEVVAVAELDETERGSNGFGSTGGFGGQPAKAAEDAVMKEPKEKAVFVEQASEPVATSPASENEPANIDVPAAQTAPEKSE
ncbi:dUTPase-like protein [Lipomyces kononenkoae]|uniref:dUTPase-like protein n=1 Tax=Lipomyces kononenkoae TaxID=34357 RepID=A0ACC3TBP3_LIPKO